ncbi:MAG: hypothetical protein ACRD0H_30550 [Actinomycetes bacterium]
MLQNGQCVGMAAAPGQPEACPTPTSGTICVNGALLGFVDNLPITATINVKAYDPSDFLGGGQPLGSGDFANGTFILKNIPAPGTALLVIAVGDADGMGTTYVTTGTGTQNVNAGKSYRVDGYVLPRTVLDGWGNTAPGGASWLTTGAYLAKYYSDPAPPDTAVIANEKTPIAGVMMTEAGAVPAGVKYFGATLAAIDGTLTATSAVGAAIAPPPPSITQFSGMGGSVATWQLEPGGSAPKVIFISRFHPGM